MSGIVNSVTDFGKYVKIRLMDIHKTQKWLAEKIGISEATLSEYIRGEKIGDDRISEIRNFLDAYADG